MSNLVTFDFDDTLRAPDGSPLPAVATLKSHLDKGDRVLVVTSRRFSSDSQAEIDEFLALQDLGHVRVLQLGADKAPSLSEMGSTLHYDDDPVEVALCAQYEVPCIQVDVPQWVNDLHREGQARKDAYVVLSGDISSEHRAGELTFFVEYVSEHDDEESARQAAQNESGFWAILYAEGARVKELDDAWLVDARHFRFVDSSIGEAGKTRLSSDANISTGFDYGQGLGQGKPLDNLRRIYELEYKIYRLSRSIEEESRARQLNHQTQQTLQRMQSELRERVREENRDLLEALKLWAKTDRDREKRDAHSVMQQMHSEGLDSITALHLGLNFVHMSGKMATHLYGSGADAALNQLSNMDTSQWDAEVRGLIRRGQASASVPYEVGRRRRADSAVPDGVFTKMLSNGEVVFVSQLGGHEVGSLWIRKDREDPTTFYVTNVKVKKDYRGQGYGRALYDAAMDWAKDNDVWLTPDVDISDDARRMWHKFEWTPGYAKEPRPRSDQRLTTHLNSGDVEPGDDYIPWMNIDDENIPQELRYRYRRAQYTPGMRIEQKERAGKRIFELWDGPKIVGRLKLEDEGDHWKVFEAEVHDDYRGKGYGRALYDEALDWAKDNSTWVAPDASISDSARKIWHRMYRDPSVKRDRSGPRLYQTLFERTDSPEYVHTYKKDELDDVPDELQHRYRRARTAAYAPTDPERVKREIRWMNQQLGKPEGFAVIEQLDTMPEESLRSLWDTYYDQLEENQGHPEMARVTVHSNNIVETHTMDAAYCLYGAGSQGVRTPWCGNRSRSLYEQYGSGGLRRFLVLPTGPDEFVEVDGQQVPVASDAYTIAVESDGKVSNINDYQNRYPGRGMDMDGAQVALQLLSQVVSGLDAGKDAVDDWEGFQGEPESWRDAGFNRTDAEEWRRLLLSSDRYENMAEDVHDESELAGAASAWESMSNGDVEFADEWVNTFLQPDEADWLNSKGVTPKAFNNFVDDVDLVWPGGWDLNIALEVIAAAVARGLTASDVADLDNPDADKLTLVQRMKAKGVSPTEELVQWVQSDFRDDPETGDPVSNPTRRIDWLATNPPEDDVDFFVDGDWELHSGESPGGVLKLLRQLTGEQDLHAADLEPYEGKTQRELVRMLKDRQRQSAFDGSMRTAMRPGVDEVLWQPAQWTGPNRVEWMSKPPVNEDQHAVSVSPVKVRYNRWQHRRGTEYDELDVESLEQGLQFALREYNLPPPPPAPSADQPKQPTQAPKPPSRLHSREKARMLDRILAERGAEGDVDWRAVGFIAPDGTKVMMEFDGQHRVEDHRSIGSYLPKRFSGGSATDAMNMVMRAIGLVRLVYTGYDYATVDHETPLTGAQQRVIEEFREETGIRRLEFSNPKGELHVAAVNVVDEAPESHDDAFWDTKQPGQLDTQDTAFPALPLQSDPDGADPWASERKREAATTHRAGAHPSSHPRFNREGDTQDGRHPHADGAIPTPRNDQVAWEPDDEYQQIARDYGRLTPGQHTNLKFYDYTPHADDIDALATSQGYDVYFAGGKYDKPDLTNRNYNTGHLMVYDPTPGSGGTFDDEKYTKAWRTIHELAHAQVYGELNEMYGEGRRIGKLGWQRTPREAKRAVHWEWLAAHRQRELAAKHLGYEVSDEVFNKELNTVMHDAVHRAITGKFTNPDLEGFEPSDQHVPLEVSLNAIDRAARKLGLTDDEALLTPEQKRQLKRKATPQGWELGDLTENHDEEDAKLDDAARWNESYHSENQFEDLTRLGQRSSDLLNEIEIEEDPELPTRDLWPSEPEEYAVMAAVDGAVVGYLDVIATTTKKGRPQLRVSLSRVSDGLRGLGIGTLLYKHVLRHAGREKVWLRPDMAVSDSARGVWHKLRRDPEVSSQFVEDREIIVNEDPAPGDEDIFEYDWKRDLAPELHYEYRIGSQLVPPPAMFETAWVEVQDAEEPTRFTIPYDDAGWKLAGAVSKGFPLTVNVVSGREIDAGPGAAWYSHADAALTVPVGVRRGLLWHEMVHYAQHLLQGRHLSDLPERGGPPRSVTQGNPLYDEGAAAAVPAGSEHALSDVEFWPLLSEWVEDHRHITPREFRMLTAPQWGKAPMSGKPMLMNTVSRFFYELWQNNRDKWKVAVKHAYAELYGREPDWTTAEWAMLADAPKLPRKAQVEYQPTVAVDLDGTLLEAPNYDAPTEPSGQPAFSAPKEGAADAMASLQELGWKVVVHTARFSKATTPKELASMKDELEAHLHTNGIHFDEVATGPKPVADAYIDDKAVLFEGDWWETIKGLTKAAQVRQASQLVPPQSFEDPELQRDLDTSGTRRALAEFCRQAGAPVLVDVDRGFFELPFVSIKRENAKEISGVNPHLADTDFLRLVVPQLQQVLEQYGVFIYQPSDARRERIYSRLFARYDIPVTKVNRAWVVGDPGAFLQWIHRDFVREFGHLVDEDVFIEEALYAIQTGDFGAADTLAGKAYQAAEASAEEQAFGDPTWSYTYFAEKVDMLIRLFGASPFSPQETSVTARNHADTLARQATTRQGRVWHGSLSLFSEVDPAVSELGFHVGTFGQAMTRLRDVVTVDPVTGEDISHQEPPEEAYLYQFDIDPKKLYRVHDMRNWSGPQLIAEFKDKLPPPEYPELLSETFEEWDEHKTEKERYDRARDEGFPEESGFWGPEDAPRRPDDSLIYAWVRDGLKSLGYQGIVYENLYERPAGLTVGKEDSYILFDSMKPSRVVPVDTGTFENPEEVSHEESRPEFHDPAIEEPLQEKPEYSWDEEEYVAARTAQFLEGRGVIKQGATREAQVVPDDPEIQKMVEGIRMSLGPDLLTPKRRRERPEGVVDSYAHCFNATNAAYHFLGGPHGPWVPHHMKVDGDSHWFLKHRETGEILDVTSDQFPGPVDYAQGKPKGMMAHDPNEPTSKGRTLMDRTIMNVGDRTAAAPRVPQDELQGIMQALNDAWRAWREVNDFDLEDMNHDEEELRAGAEFYTALLNNEYELGTEYVHLDESVTHTWRGDRDLVRRQLAEVNQLLQTGDLGVPREFTVNAGGMIFHVIPQPAHSRADAATYDKETGAITLRPLMSDDQVNPAHVEHELLHAMQQDLKLSPNKPWGVPFKQYDESDEWGAYADRDIEFYPLLLTVAHLYQQKADPGESLETFVNRPEVQHMIPRETRRRQKFLKHLSQQEEVLARVAYLRDGKTPGEKAALVVRLPEFLAEQFPEGLAERNGPPHFTLAYLSGPFDETDRQHIETLTREVLEDHGAFRLELAEGVEWFENDEGQSIAHKAPEEGLTELTALADDLRARLMKEGYEVSYGDEPFKAHATIAYCDERNFEGFVPEGGFLVDAVQLWGWPEPTPTIHLSNEGLV